MKLKAKLKFLFNFEMGLLVSLQLRDRLRLWVEFCFHQPRAKSRICILLPVPILPDLCVQWSLNDSLISRDKKFPRSNFFDDAEVQP